MRILVIEDERTLAGFIEQALHAEGYAVTVAHDGENGELLAVTGDYALVLLDLMLPGKGGLDVLDAIRARMPELPVIVLTARTAVEQKVQGLDRGANDYVTKRSRSRGYWRGFGRTCADPRSGSRRCSMPPAFASICVPAASSGTGTRST